MDVRSAYTAQPSPGGIADLYDTDPIPDRRPTARPCRGGQHEPAPPPLGATNCDAPDRLPLAVLREAEARTPGAGRASIAPVDYRHASELLDDDCRGDDYESDYDNAWFWLIAYAVLIVVLVCGIVWACWK